MANVSENCAVLRLKKFRAVRATRRAQNPIISGGAGNIVEIVECRLTKKKIYVGRGTRLFWIFGGYDRKLSTYFK